MRSPLDGLQTPTPVNLRRFPRGLHSVAKRASFSFALKSDFKGFGSDVGRFWEAKMGARIDFRGFFCDAFSDRVLASILHGFLEARNMKNRCFS